MKIAVGSDHLGFNLKQELIAFLDEKGLETKDILGVCRTSPSTTPTLRKSSPKASQGVMWTAQF